MFDRGQLQVLTRSAILCLLSGIVLGLAADNVLGRTGLSTTYLPQVFKLNTLPAATRQELANGRDEEAIALARKAVQRQPLSVEALASLAWASATSRPSMSSDALGQAARLGWRDAPVQVAIIKSAALTKNWSVVAPRLAALANMNKLDEVDPSIFAIEDADFSEKIAPAFADYGLAWFKFVNWLRDKGLSRQSNDLLLQTPAFDRQDACIQLGFLAFKVVREGRGALAATIVNSHCDKFLTSTESGLVIDQNFGDSQRGPFEWQTSGYPGVSVVVEKEFDGTFLEVVNGDPLPRPVATKIMQRGQLLNGDVVNAIAMRSRTRKHEVIPLDIKCIDRPDKVINYVSVSGKELANRCNMVRVTFALPTGHFRVWSSQAAKPAKP